MIPPYPSSQTTAYAFNRRPGAVAAPAPRAAATRERLRARDYQLLPGGFTAGGVLFRGIAPFSAAALAAGDLAPNRHRHSLCALEQEIGAMLVSHEASDAIAVSRIDRGERDAAVAVLPVAAYRSRAAIGEAGILGFAEPGVVFRYPFLGWPVALTEALAVFVHRRFLTRLRVAAPVRALPGFHRAATSVLMLGGEPLPVIGIDADSRRECEHAIQDALAAGGFEAATFSS